MLGTTRNEKFTVPVDLLAAPLTRKWPLRALIENSSSVASSAATPSTISV
jgi:hypothetical protein